MNTNFKVALAVVAGAALGATAMQGLHAQAKLKAYSVAEVETLDPAGQMAYIPAIRKAIEAAHGHALRTIGVGQRGRRSGILQIESLEGLCAPARQGSKDDTALRRRSRKVVYSAARRARPPSLGGRTQYLLNASVVFKRR